MSARSRVAAWTAGSRRRVADCRMPESRSTAQLLSRTGNPPSQDCFADEAAIDFPAVAPLVDRIRTAFLGSADDAAVFATTIALARHAALRGAHVPLEVPVRMICACCGGRGETWDEACRFCAGSGHAFFHHPVHFRVPPGVRDGARIRFRLDVGVSAPTEVVVAVSVR